MRKVTTCIIIFLLSGLLWSPSLCLADTVLGGDFTRDVAKKGGYSETTDETSITETIGSIVRVVLGLIGTIFIGLTVYAGYLWLTAGGEDEKVTKAKNILQTAVIGLIIVLSAYSLSYFIVNWVIDSQEVPEEVGGLESPYMTL